MRAYRRTILGVEIGPQELRLVEVRGGAAPQVLRLGAVPLPEDALDGDRIVLIDAVANLLRGLAGRLNCESRVAVFGIGMQSVITRVVQVPHVPEAELRVVLEGELAHYHILRTGMGAFDWTTLQDGTNRDDGMQSILIMAIEQRIARGYRQVAEKAGLELLALEPLTLALYRTAFPRLQAGAEAVCLMVTGSRCELSVVSQGNIRLYRRLEIGSNDFLTGRLPQSEIHPISLDLSNDSSQYGSGSEDNITPRLLDSIVSTRTRRQEGASTPGDENTLSGLTDRIWTLADEIQRSLDYYQREFPTANLVSRVLLCTNDPDAAIIEPWLRQQLQMDVRVVEPIPGQTEANSAALAAPRGLKFLAAYGLALHPLTADWKQCPHFDLTPTEPASLGRADRDKAVVIFGTGLIILITGLIAGRLFARLAELEATSLGSSRARLATQRRMLQERETQITQERALSRIVRSDNLPVGNLLELITTQLPGHVSLISLDMQRNGHIMIEGEARTPQDFDAFYVKLQVCPHFVATRYTRMITDSHRNLTQFRIETSVYGTQDAVLRSHN